MRLGVRWKRPDAATGVSLHFWGDGDLDREQVEEARRKLAQLDGA
jgi:hypothetical protein